MVKIISRVEIKRQTGFRLLVSETVGITDLIERGFWAASIHAPLTHQGRINGCLEEHEGSKSGRLAVVILEQPAQALAAGDDSNLLADLRTRLQDPVIQSSVRSVSRDSGT